MPKAWATQVEIHRALKAVEEFGLPIREIEISKGSVRIITSDTKAEPVPKGERAPKSW